MQCNPDSPRDMRVYRSLCVHVVGGCVDLQSPTPSHVPHQYIPINVRQRFQHGTRVDIPIPPALNPTTCVRVPDVSSSFSSSSPINGLCTPQCPPVHIDFLQPVGTKTRAHPHPIHTQPRTSSLSWRLHRITPPFLHFRCSVCPAPLPRVTKYHTMLRQAPPPQSDPTSFPLANRSDKDKIQEGQDSLSLASSRAHFRRRTPKKVVEIHGALQQH